MMVRFTPLAAVAVLASVSHAQTTTYTDRAAFEAAAAARGIPLLFESFETDSLGDRGANFATRRGLEFASLVSPGDTTFEVTDQAFQIVPGFSINPATDGDVYLDTDDPTDGQPGGTLLRFGGRVRALGFDAIDYINAPGGPLVLVDSITGQQFNVASGGPGFTGDSSFFGIIFDDDNEFRTSLRLISNNDGTGYRLDALAYSVPIDGDLGPIANPDVPFVFRTTDNIGPTAIAIWNESGNLVAIQSENRPYGQSEIRAILPEPGTYTIGATLGPASFFQNFDAQVQTPGQPFTNLRFAVENRERSDALIFDRVLRYTVDASFDNDAFGFAGIIPARGVGPVAEPFMDFTISGASDAGQSVDFAIYDRKTGEVLTTARNTQTANLPAGEYVLGVAPEAVSSRAFQDGYTVGVNPTFSSSDLVDITINGSVVEDLAFEDDVVRFIAFEVGEAALTADLDNNGVVNFLDVLIFLQLVDQASP